MINIAEITANDAVSLIKRKEISSTELVHAVAEAAAERDPVLHAYLDLDIEKAMEQAKAIDHKISSKVPVGPLAGIRPEYVAAGVAFFSEVVNALTTGELNLVRSLTNILLATASAWLAGKAVSQQELSKAMEALAKIIVRFDVGVLAMEFRAVAGYFGYRI